MDYLQHWNMPSPPRPEQVEVLNFISASNKRTIIAHCPAGTGKSGICATLAAASGGSVVTPHILLQAQYLRDWPRSSLIKGRSNYICENMALRKKAGDVALRDVEPTCKLGASAGCKTQSCPYTCAKDAFLLSSMGVTNYNWLLSYLQTMNEGLPNHSWLLFDEGHELESKLIDAATLTVTEETCHRYGIPYQEYDDPDDAVDWLLVIVTPVLRARANELRDTLNTAINKPIPILREYSNLSEMLSGIDFISSRKNQEDWVYDFTAGRNSKATFRPLYASGLFDYFIKPLAKRHFITSATMGTARMMQEWLGFDDYDEVAVDCPFPRENRQVYITPAASLNKGNIDQMMPKIVRAVEQVLEGHEDEKGIIHSVSFKLGLAIFTGLSPEHRRRILLHTPQNTRDSLLAEHVTSSKPTVLMSPSMSEGVDLAGPLSRFTIIPKVPYPYLGDKWVMMRKNDDSKWYRWQVAKTVMQMVGRSVRSLDDYANCYILDGNFLQFYGDNAHLFPKWFRQSVVAPA